MHRFWSKTVWAGDCLVWTGSKNPQGYGKVSFNGRIVYAHRLAFKLEHGRWPELAILHHTCRNTSCVLAEHLEEVSSSKHAVKHTDGEDAVEQTQMSLADPITRLVDAWLRTQPGEYSEIELQEIYRIARGWSLDRSAADTNRAAETIRSRRKGIYYKLNVQGAREIQGSLLRFALFEGGILHAVSENCR